MDGLEAAGCVAAVLLAGASFDLLNETGNGFAPSGPVDDAIRIEEFGVTAAFVAGGVEDIAGVEATFWSGPVKPLWASAFNEAPQPPSDTAALMSRTAVRADDTLIGSDGAGVLSVAVGAVNCRWNRCRHRQIVWMLIGDDPTRTRYNQMVCLGGTYQFFCPLTAFAKHG